MRILAVGAHPDDIEILCGGTLAKYVSQGHEVFMAIATNGEVGSPTLSKEEIAAVRYEEAKKSAEIIGATLIWMGFPDEFLFNNLETRMAFIEAIRQANPDVMFVHGTNDYHPDHRTAGQIAIDCRIPVTVPLIKTQSPPCDRVPHVFIMDNVGGIEFQPEDYVDISDFIETKTNMLMQHVSQDLWLRTMYNMTYGDFMKGITRKRGLEAGFQYAEGFRSVKTYPITGGFDLLP